MAVLSGFPMAPARSSAKPRRITRPQVGPAFIKTVAYAPSGIWIYLNGHEWAQRQAEKRRIDFEALDHGFRSVEDSDALAGICQTLYYRDIERFWSYWEQRLPSPLSAEDRDRGYGYGYGYGYSYRLSIRQLELSDTRVFERPRTFATGLS